jgi:hypothetical protein
MRISTMNNYLTGRRRIAAACTGIAILAATFISGCKSDPVAPATDVVNGVYKPDSKPFGKTYAEWSATWWQWAFQQPATNGAGAAIHPLLDTTGANFNAAASTSGDVIFLGGSLGPASPLTRTITIPSGKAILFPMINVFADTTGGWTIDSMRAAMTSAPAKVTNVLAEIDGQAVAGAHDYHFASAQFSAALPDHNIYQYWGNPIPAATTMPYLADGFWIMLAPLAKGSHTLHFHGATSDGILQDITYKLTVQ